MYPRLFKNAFLKRTKRSPLLRTNWSPQPRPTPGLKRGRDHRDASLDESLPNHHSRFAVSGAMAQCPRRLSAEQRLALTSRRARGATPGFKITTPASSAARSSSSMAQPGWRADREAHPPRRPHHFPPLRQRIRSKPNAIRLRSSRATGCRQRDGSRYAYASQPQGG